MSKLEDVRRVCPICGMVRRDIVRTVGVRKVWTCYHCLRDFSPPKSKDSLYLKIRTLLAGKSHTVPGTH
jgi:hypothetical protein